MSSYVFKFIAGKYEGGEFTLPRDGEVLIGRSIEVPICLVEDMVSRRHARLTISGHELSIQDLGSTNGTFVNGERIEQSKLAAGDRVLVGTSIMRLESLQAIVDAESKPLPSAVQIADELTKPTQVAPTADNVPEAAPPKAEQPLSGSLSDMKLSEVVELVTRSQRTGTLALSVSWGTAALGFANGQLCHAQASEPFDKLSAQKLMCRLLGPITEAGGSFDFGGGAPASDASISARSTETYLLEAARINDEVERKLDALGATRTSALRMTPQKGRKISALPPAQLDVLQTALEQQSVSGTLDACDGPDDEVLGHLAALIGEGYLAL